MEAPAFQLINDARDTLDSFPMVDVDFIRRIIMTSPTKSCDLDPIPTHILKNPAVLDILAPFITTLVNLSLRTGKFPENLKHGLVTPLLKKPNLDREVLSNFRPITKSAFLSKVIERVAVTVLDEHLAVHNILTSSQYAYRRNHSTETYLLALQDDLLIAVDRGKGTVVLLLDLSAAFDTIDHEILLKRIQSHCGISGTVLAWFRSYLTGRTQSVVVNGVRSSAITLKHGVPQGSVIGPKLYIIYVNCLQQVVARYGIKIKQYSDDTTIYLEFSFPPEIPDLRTALDLLSSCAGDLLDWFTYNWVRPNPDKSEWMCFTASKLESSPPEFQLDIKERSLQPVSSARILGFTFESYLSPNKHISTITKKSFFHIYRLAQIRDRLTPEVTKTLVHAFIISSLDYANSLLTGCTKAQLKPLQSVQDAAARLIVRDRSISTEKARFDLHCLPVAERIDYKIILLTFDCLYGTAPDHLTSVIRRYVPRRAGHRSHDPDSAVILETNTWRRDTHGGRAFSNYAPKAWNTLPPQLRKETDRRIFKSRLRTHFFALAYPHFTRR